MGFPVTGPGGFLGSGHPDLREPLPGRLGLIRSTDAGRSWLPVSLLGQAVLHALQAAHGQVYGYDATSSTVLVSVDGGASGSAGMKASSPIWPSTRPTRTCCSPATGGASWPAGTAGARSPPGPARPLWWRWTGPLSS